MGGDETHVMMSVSGKDLNIKYVKRPNCVQVCSQPFVLLHYSQPQLNHRNVYIYSVYWRPIVPQDVVHGNGTEGMAQHTVPYTKPTI